MSDSEQVSDMAMEDSLRREVALKWDSGELTVNVVRRISEEMLGLEKDFYLTHPVWKSESKRIIKDEIVKQEAAAAAQPPDLSIPQTTSPPAKRPLLQGPVVPRKKQKTSEPSTDDDADLSSPPGDMDMNEQAAKPKKKAHQNSNGSTSKPAKASGKKTVTKVKPQKKSKAKPKPAEEASDSDVPTEDVTMPAKSIQRSPNVPADDSDSALSSPIDEELKSKKGRKGSGIPEKKSEKSSKLKTKATPVEDLNAAEIKRLQNWLVKCGIRKLWGKELKPYETPKEKIKHLKDMLAEVGMTGRYSQEKANQIKEQRELAADIEAVQEGAERWGKDEEESEGDGDGRPQRRIVRGAKNYDFLSSDGEETS